MELVESAMLVSVAEKGPPLSGGPFHLRVATIEERRKDMHAITKSKSSSFHLSLFTFHCALNHTRAKTACNLHKPKDISDFLFCM
jgi:hypothetical protein